MFQSNFPYSNWLARESFYRNFFQNVSGFKFSSHNSNCSSYVALWLLSKWITLIKWPSGLPLNDGYWFLNHAWSLALVDCFKVVRIRHRWKVRRRVCGCCNNTEDSIPGKVLSWEIDHISLVDNVKKQPPLITIIYFTYINYLCNSADPQSSRNTNRGGSGTDKILIFIIHISYILKLTEGLKRKKRKKKS